MQKNKNKTPKTGIIIISIAVSFILYNSSFAQHKRFTSDDMPKAVIESFNKTYPNAEAVGFDIEKENGNKFYEIESKEGEIRRDILFKEDGTIQEVEENMKVSDLSQEAVNSIQNKYPGSKFIKAEKIIKNNETMYEVIVKTKKKKQEVLVKTDGTIMNNENNDEDEER